MYRIVECASSAGSYDVVDCLWIGRDPRRCQIVLPRDAVGVSKVHAVVRLEDGRCYITDQSTHGTFVNAKKVLNKKQPLGNGDKLKIGQHEYTVHVGSILEKIYAEETSRSELDKGRGKSAQEGLNSSVLNTSTVASSTGQRKRTNESQLPDAKQRKISNFFGVGASKSHKGREENIDGDVSILAEETSRSRLAHRPSVGSNTSIVKETVFPTASNTSSNKSVQKPKDSLQSYANLRKKPEPKPNNTEKPTSDDEIFFIDDEDLFLDDVAERKKRDEEIPPAQDSAPVYHANSSELGHSECGGSPILSQGAPTSNSRQSISGDRNVDTNRKNHEDKPNVNQSSLTAVLFSDEEEDGDSAPRQVTAPTPTLVTPTLPQPTFPTPSLRPAARALTLGKSSSVQSAVTTQLKLPTPSLRAIPSLRTSSRLNKHTVCAAATTSTQLRPANGATSEDRVTDVVLPSMNPTNVISPSAAPTVRGRKTISQALEVISPRKRKQASSTRASSSTTQNEKRGRTGRTANQESDLDISQRFSELFTQMCSGNVKKEALSDDEDNDQLVGSDMLTERQKESIADVQQHMDKIVSFCDLSRPLTQQSFNTTVYTSGGKNVKTFKKAGQGRFNTTVCSMSSLGVSRICGPDLADYRTLADV